MIVPLIKKELYRDFLTPLAYVFLGIFLIFSGALTFFLGDILGQGRADLSLFFQFLPWLFLLLIPALSMPAWAEEKASGTIELLLTLPVSIERVTIAKYISVSLMVLCALILTLPLPLSIAYLGDPDFGVIVSGYVGALLLGMNFAAVGLWASSVTSNQVIAYVYAATVSLLLLLIGTPVVLGFFQQWLAPGLVDIIAGFSIIAIYENFARGIIYLGDVLSIILYNILFLMLSCQAVRRGRI